MNINMIIIMKLNIIIISIVFVIAEWLLHLAIFGFTDTVMAIIIIISIVNIFLLSFNTITSLTS